ncbi:hypothetical protein HFP89_14975 [Wenzhouxiangella sp. XN79A]|uniref:hypothetical protein n=1 Tax=Wenzhouxiangella sp. XN79A TaxID=2724193 RepID=UPI00144A9DB6|nr:hypothetical protein [Wenzhouxiangella sp. XN79A]NKI36471.1 hypothetical protein [Wenzhouxiangella sp. XN79A]
MTGRIRFGMFLPTPARAALAVPRSCFRKWNLARMRGTTRSAAIPGTSPESCFCTRGRAVPSFCRSTLGLLLIGTVLAVGWPPSGHAEGDVDDAAGSSPPVRQAGGAFAVPWSSIDGGGGRSRSLDYDVQGTFGQPDAHVMIGEDFTVKAGFWPSADTTNLDLIIFRDGFESFPITR